MHEQNFELQHVISGQGVLTLICASCEVPMDKLRIRHADGCTALMPLRVSWPDGVTAMAWDRLQEAIGTAHGAAEHAADVGVEFGARISSPSPVISYTTPPGVTSMETGTEGQCGECGAGQYLMTVFAKADGPRVRCMDTDGCRRRRTAVKLAEIRDALVRSLIDAVTETPVQLDDDSAVFQAVHGVLQRFGVTT